MLAFDRKASSYHRNSHVQQDSADWVSAWLPTDMAGARCLEFGAGSGNLTRSLTPQFSHVEASDIAPAMVAEGRLRHDEAQWEIRDAWNPDIPPIPEWDMITSASLLQWAADPVEVIQRWARLLRPDGRILCGIYVRPSLPELGMLLPEACKFRWLEANDWAQAFAAAGLKVLRHESLTRRYVYPSPQVMMRRLHDTGVALSHNPLSVSVMKQILRQYAHANSLPGGVCATWTTLRIEASL
jgi:malonyl-CoA O-methyltransferase